MYFQPLKRKALSLLGQRSPTLLEASARVWDLAPSQRQIVPDAIYNPADLTRVTASWHGTTIQSEVDKLRAGSRDHASTTAYLLRNVDVVDGYLYAGQWKDRMLPARPPLFASAPDIRFEQGSLACTWSGNSFFGHWITDDLTLYLAAEQTGHPFIIERQPYLHESEYRELLGIPGNNINRAHYHELIILRDFGQNDYKRARYDTLRKRLRTNVPLGNSERIFLRRGALGQSRNIVNATEMEAYLISEGFAVVEPENLTSKQIAAKTMGAKIVVGVEGSQIPHALLSMAEGGTLCCIQPPSRFNNTIRGYTDCLDLNYAIVVGHAERGGFRVDIDDLKYVLEKIEQVTERV